MCKFHYFPFGLITKKRLSEKSINEQPPHPYYHKNYFIASLKHTTLTITMQKTRLLVQTSPIAILAAAMFCI